MVSPVVHDESGGCSLEGNAEEMANRKEKSTYISSVGGSRILCYIPANNQYELPLIFSHISSNFIRCADRFVLIRFAGRSPE